jgi:hypothetical protein
LARHGRFQHCDAVCIEIDLAEIIAGKRSKEHLAIRRCGDAVGTSAPRRIERGHLACFGVTPLPYPFRGAWAG